jgi:hypothetical protein
VPSTAALLDDVDEFDDVPFAAPFTVPGSGIAIRPLANPAEPDRRARLRIVPPLADVAEPPTVRELHDRLKAVLEVLDGRRPATVLVDLLPYDVRTALLAHPLARGGGPRTLCTIHPHRTNTGAVDIAARVEHAGRSRALVARLEVDRDQWRFTLLTMI